MSGPERGRGAALLADLVRVAAAGLARGDRVREMAEVLEAAPGFLGVFTRLDPVAEPRLRLREDLEGTLDPEDLEDLLAEELAPFEDDVREPGLPRQLTLDGEVLGTPDGVCAILLWDESGRDPEAGPHLLGGLLVAAHAPLLRDPALFALLEVLQLSLSRDLHAERLEDYRAGLELLNALQPPRMRGERSLVARALSEFRRVLPYDLAALALLREGEPPEVRYLVPPECPPAFVQAGKAEVRDALGLGREDALEEVYHNEPGGPPAGPGRAVESMLVLPLVGHGGDDLGRIGFFSSTPGFFTTHHLRLLGLLAPSLASALVAVRGAEGLRDRAVALEAEQARVEAQLELARRIQTQILAPCEGPPSGVVVAGRNAMTQAVGGDFFLGRRLGRHRYAAAVADVSGKGLPAGLLMCHTRGALLAALDVNPEPAHVLGRMNRVVHESTDHYSFVTMAMVLVDVRKGIATVASAGHEPLLRLSPDGALHEHPGEDPPLGILPDHAFEVHGVPFEVGDTLLLLSDGVYDVQDRGGERFGRERMRRVLLEGARDPAAVVARLMDAVDAWRGSRDLADDATLLALGRVEPA